MKKGGGKIRASLSWDDKSHLTNATVNKWTLAATIPEFTKTNLAHHRCL